ncbi:MAG: tRNA pseudouridine(13) synthase TruD [Exilibacterium sp.]
MTAPFSLEFPYVLGAPSSVALFRTQLDDFQVDEQIDSEPSGEGEHVFLHLRKKGENTDWLARQIARLAGVKPMDVGYCGLKDRRGVCSQWFSVYLPGPASSIEPPRWQTLNSETVDVLAVSRHQRKLRRGGHRANRFSIRLRKFSSEVSTPVSVTDPTTVSTVSTVSTASTTASTTAPTTAPTTQLTLFEEVEKRLLAIKRRGVPNYFGEQRFGHGGNNLTLADRYLSGAEPIRDRHRRGLAVSAARAYLFNLVLAERVRQGIWNRSVEGDVVLHDASQELPAGPLWGRGRSAAAAASLDLENAVLSKWSHWREALEHKGLKQERRSLVLMPQELQWNWEGGDLWLTFSLPPGCFATAVLREVCRLVVPMI